MRGSLSLEFETVVPAAAIDHERRGRFADGSDAGGETLRGAVLPQNRASLAHDDFAQLKLGDFDLGVAAEGNNDAEQKAVRSPLP